MIAKITLPNTPIDLWSLGKPNPRFRDEYEILEYTFNGLYDTLGYDFKGSIVGYVDIYEDPNYSWEEASGRYKMNVYTTDGQLLDLQPIWADKIGKWAGGPCRLPFVGYAFNSNVTMNLPEVRAWLIIPKSQEQLLNAAAAFYKRKKKKDEVPNIIGIADYISKNNKIGEIITVQTYKPIRERLREGKKTSICNE